MNNDEVRGKFEKAWNATLPAKPLKTVVEIMEAAHKRGEIKALYVMGKTRCFPIRT